MTTPFSDTADFFPSSTDEPFKKEVSNHLGAWDISVVFLYFVLVLATGFYSMLSSNRSTVSGYFLAGRFMFWLPVGASVFASNIGSEHFIGLAGSGAAAGIGVGAFELNALWILQLTGWVFLPVFIASRVCTLPEYMSKRFGGNRIRTYLAILSLILYIFTKISVNLFAGGIFIRQALGWNLYMSVIVLLALTAVCTVTGGLTAVIYTDTLQCFVMIFGAGIVAIRAFVEIGGYQRLEQEYMNAMVDTTGLSPNLTECARPNPHAFQLLRAADDPDIPWPGFLLGQTPASIWYWCTDQMMVQRLLAAKSLSHAQGGTLFAGYLKILPLFLIIMPGMISRVLYTEEIACVDPVKCKAYCGNPVSCSNIAYPKLVLELMPAGLKGLMLAVMLAALMSDLSSIFNSASTLFTCDIWPRIRKNSSIRELMIVGRTFVIVMVLISLLWIPVIQQTQGGQLFIYIQAISADLAPPIAAVYLMAVLWPRLNERGAFWSLMVGFFIGASRMILDFVYIAPKCGEIDDRPILTKVHYMYFAIILFWATIITGVLISYMTEPPEPFRLIRTTYWSRFDERPREDDKDNLELKRAEKKKQKREEINRNEVITSLKEAENGLVVKKEIERPSSLKRAWNWFCGLESGPESDEKEAAFYEHLAEIAGIHQTRTEKTILGVSLVLVIGVAIGLYTYFSIPMS